MIQERPASVGMPETEIDTPALLIDLDAFEFNLGVMAEAVGASSARLRPHAKTHKSPVIAHLQQRHGAVGQCVQKVAEAEILAWSGVTDILVSNEVVGTTKLARLAALAHIAKISVCADHPAQVDALQQAAAAAAVRLTVLVEIDVGPGRCGLPPGEPAVLLAERIAAAPNLDFGGLQAYHGAAQHQRTLAQQQATIETVIAETRRTAAQLKQHGLDCAIIGGGGTGTFRIEATSGVFNEIQAGSYIFMDADYARNGAAPPFRQSLFVLTTVMSAARADAAVVDAGHKAVPIDSGFPLVGQRPNLSYTGASDEHGTLRWLSGEGPTLGEKLRLVPGHCDPTVDRYDWYVCVRRGHVECLWPIPARGAMT